MPLPDWEDLSEFLDVEEFATVAVFTPDEGDPFDVVGIYDEPYFNTDLGEYEFDLTAPRLLCRQADTVNIKRGMFCQIDNKEFQVDVIKPDGTGMATVMLAQVQVYT